MEKLSIHPKHREVIIDVCGIILIELIPDDEIISLWLSGLYIKEVIKELKRKYKLKHKITDDYKGSIKYAVEHAIFDWWKNGGKI